MYLKSISGKILFEGRFHTIKYAVEAAVQENINLDFINLRHADLKGANLDNASLKGASFWGANLEKANLTGVNLQNSDCRNANFKDCCLAESNCHQADFRGSYFSRTLFTDTDLSNTKFSCPSLFNINLSDARSLENATYIHKGEVDCDLSIPPVIIHGLPKNIILMQERTLIGNSLYDIGLYHRIFSSFEKVIHYEKIMKTKIVK